MAKVFVGLSGGVDSATAAALLKKQGYDVEGVFIKIWQPEFIECRWKEDRLDAMRVAVALRIPFRELDLSEEYKREVVREMTRCYAEGYTPNPDVLCNKQIKFGSFLRYAISSGADFIATGHYARVEKSRGLHRLLRGADPEKDQSYFLHELGQRELSHALFPIGAVRKQQVRARARSLHLPVAGKPDSQGLCFVGDVSLEDFLSRFIPISEGPVLDTNGRTIGVHRGAALYTRGQRHGFIVQEGKRAPHFVVDTDVQSNTITVSDRPEGARRGNAFVRDMHWVAEKRSPPLEALVQTRYQQEPRAARIENAGEGINAIFSEPRLASSGQSLVLYEKDECLGGGVMTH